MEAAERGEAAALLLRYWDPRRVQDGDRQPDLEYLHEADAVLALLKDGAGPSRLTTYLAQAGHGVRVPDREERAAWALVRWYVHRVSTDPWSVQVELEIDEPLHHSVVEGAERRLGPWSAVSQSEGVVVVNVTVARQDPLEAAGEGLRLAREHLPGPHLIHRVTFWRHIV